MRDAGDAIPCPPARRERRRGPRMIGRWPDGIRFEDADVPREPPFRGGASGLPGLWPASSLEAAARIARGR